MYISRIKFHKSIYNIEKEINMPIADDFSILNEIRENGKTALMLAAAEGNLSLVERLMENGAEVNARGKYCMSPLHEAALNDHANIAQYLILHGADIDSLTSQNITPLMCAAAWGCAEVAEILIKSGANVNIVDEYGLTALDIAKEKEELVVFKLLEGAIKIA